MILSFALDFLAERIINAEPFIYIYGKVHSFFKHTIMLTGNDILMNLFH